MNAELAVTQNRHHAVLRVWAANLRDRRPPYQTVDSQVSDLGRTLCVVLDALHTTTKLQERPGAARNLDQTARQNVQTILARLAQKGYKPPTTQSQTAIKQTTTVNAVTLHWHGNFCYMCQNGLVVGGYDAVADQYYRLAGGKWVRCEGREV